jgi:transposase
MILGSKARLVITAVVVEGRSQAEVARAYGVSQPWISRLVARWRAEGEAAFEARARRPRSSPNATPQPVVDRILALRKTLTEQGLDAGPHTLVWHLQRERITVSAATVSRILTRHGVVVPDPSKRPKSSYRRFQAEPLAVVAHAQHYPFRARCQRHLDVRGARVARGVGQAFLCDAVEHQFGLGTEPGKVGLEAAPHREAGMGGELGGQRGEGADKAEVVQHAGAQAARDAAHLVQALPSRFLRVAQICAQGLGSQVTRPLELEQDRGQALAYLVVQLLGDAAPLSLLCRQRACGAGAPLRLQPVEHLVERRDQLGHLTAAGDSQALPRALQVDPGHQARQVLERSQPDAQQDSVGGQADRETGEEDPRLGGQHRGRDGHGREEQQSGGRDKDRRVEQQDPPVQGHGVGPPSPGR